MKAIFSVSLDEKRSRSLCHEPIIDPTLLSQGICCIQYLYPNISFIFDCVSHWLFNLFESKVAHWLHSSVWICNLMLAALRRHSLKWVTCVKRKLIWALLLKCVDETRVDLQDNFLLNIWVCNFKIVLFWTHFYIMFYCDISD